MDTPLADIVLKNELDYLLRQYNKGLCPPNGIAKLMDAGLVKRSPYSQATSVKKEDEVQEEDLFQKTKHFLTYQYKFGIKKEDWKPTSTIKHSTAFRNWIDSMTFGVFKEKINYEPFNMYKAQAIQWCEEQSDPYKYFDTEEQVEAVKIEKQRCKENSLYFAMKYGRVKEGVNSEGLIAFKPKEHNAVLLFLLDCGYSLFLGKPRQIFASTTVGLFALNKCISQYNFYIKFISEDDKTSKEIFRDKIKYPFGELPKWHRPNVLGDSLQGFHLGAKTIKGEVEAPNSIIEVLAPTETAINGGSPSLSLIDEAANIDILTEMLVEALPTMYKDRNGDGNLEMKSQVVIWSTGTSGNKGKGAWEREYKKYIKLWQEGNDTVGFVPIFFSWDTRCNGRHYNQQKEIYFGGKFAEMNNMDIETSKRMFAQHYPSRWMDMFAATSSTLVSNEILQASQVNIRRKYAEGTRLLWGYFEPIFDINKPYSENFDIPYAIKGARFVPVDDDNSDLATCMMFLEPDTNFRNRYFQGTDPIANDTGVSMFASAIWDKHHKTIACLLNFRKAHDSNYCFLQALLMGIYYDTNNFNTPKTSVPDLVEANISALYVNYKDNRGFGRRLVYNAELPQEVRGGGGRVGIDNRSGVRNAYITSKLKECILTYHLNIYYDIIFDQLRTFTRRVNTDKESWGTIDKKTYFDDALFALAYAYICSEYVYAHLSPQELNIQTMTEPKIRYILQDNGKSLTRIPVRG